MSHDDNNDGSDGLPPEGAIVDPGPEYAYRLKLYNVHSCLPKGTSFSIRNACWVELMRLQADGAIDIYLPAGWGAAGFRWFNVWDNRAWERCDAAWVGHALVCRLSGTAGTAGTSERGRRRRVNHQETRETPQTHRTLRAH